MADDSTHAVAPSAEPDAPTVGAPLGDGEEVVATAGLSDDEFASLYRELFEKETQWVRRHYRLPLPLAEDVVASAFAELWARSKNTDITYPKAYIRTIIFSEAMKVKRHETRRWPSAPERGDDPGVVKSHRAGGPPEPGERADPDWTLSEEWTVARLNSQSTLGRIAHFVKTRRAECETNVRQGSDDPEKYREVIVSVAEGLVTNGVYLSRDATVDAYIRRSLAAQMPEWFDPAPGGNASRGRRSPRDMRVSRGKKDVLQLLGWVLTCVGGPSTKEIP